MTNPYQPQPATILDIRRQTASDSTFRLAWETPAQPGQFFEVSVPRLGEAPISISAIGDGYLEMTIRKMGCVTEGIFALRVGDTLFLRGPYGHGFPLARLAGSSLLIAAGGTGLAPVKPVIEYCLAHPELFPRCEVLLGFRSPRELLFREEIVAWQQQIPVQVTVDQADDAWTGHVGVITRLIPALDLSPLDGVQAVVVGPPLMMKFTVLALLERGLRAEQIWVSYERRMSCGLGKCGHCKINEKYVCVDGPVFNFAEARWLID
jgi:anaerobic sulfite reductase subunit B